MSDRDEPVVEVACDHARPIGVDSRTEGIAAALERAIASDFPTVRVAQPGGGATRVSIREWRAPSYDPQALDAELAAHAERGALRIEIALDDVLDDGEAGRALMEILTRAQPYLDRRNAASAGPRFDRALGAHHSLHDLTKPLVRADYAHALDVWQWTLRLEPSASFEVQLAALFHDVERLASESHVRIEQHARDYAAFKRAHARRGAELARAVLARIDLDAHTADRVAELVASHEAPHANRERTVLNDADALSFFSLNSAGFADYYGLRHARTKVAYTLARLSARGRAELGALRLRADIAALLAEMRARAEEEP